MNVREFIRTWRDCLVFILIMAGLLIGYALSSALVGAASFRHPWTWILPVVGLGVFESIVRIIYKKPRKKKSASMLSTEAPHHPRG
jgi:hypothetical protein